MLSSRNGAKHFETIVFLNPYQIAQRPFLLPHYIEEKKKKESQKKTRDIPKVSCLGFVFNFMIVSLTGIVQVIDELSEKLDTGHRYVYCRLSHHN